VRCERREDPGGDGLPAGTPAGLTKLGVADALIGGVVDVVSGRSTDATLRGVMSGASTRAAVLQQSAGVPFGPHIL
jgi:hypothetical protein